MTALLLALQLAATERSVPVEAGPAPEPGAAATTGPGVGAELLGLVYLRTDPIDGGLIGLGSIGGVVTLDAEAAFGPIVEPDASLRLAAELLVVRTEWGGGEGTDALAVSQTSWLGSPRLRVGWAFGARLQLQPFLSLGPALYRTSVSYRIEDPAIESSIDDAHAGWLLGLTGAGGALVSLPLTDTLLLLGRLEVDLVRRGGTTDAAFGLGLGVQLGHVTPPAPRAR